MEEVAGQEMDDRQRMDGAIPPLYPLPSLLLCGYGMKRWTDPLYPPSTQTGQ